MIISYFKKNRTNKTQKIYQLIKVQLFSNGTKTKMKNLKASLKVDPLEKVRSFSIRI